MIYRINAFLISIIIGFAPAYALAASDYKTPRVKALEQLYYRSIQSQAYLEAQGIVEVVEDGSKKLVRANAKVPVAASEVGVVMMKRLAAGAAAAAGGVLAYQATKTLLEGIGWILEDGGWVKIKSETDESNEAKGYQGFSTKPNGNKKFFKTAKAACDDLKTFYPESGQFISLNQVSDSSPGVPRFNCVYANSSGYVLYKTNPDPQPDNSSNTKVPLDATTLGCAILGTGCYHDPVDPSIDTTVNNGVGNPDIVTAAATPDPASNETTESNPLAKKVDKALKDGAKDGTTVKDGSSTTTTSTTTPKKDQNGNPTGETETKTDGKLPAFCDWASYVCDWIDWTKEDEIPEKDPIDIDIDPPIEKKIIDITFGSACPEATYTDMSLNGQTAQIAVSDYQYICRFAPIIKIGVITFASIQAVFIIARRQTTGSDD